MGKGANIIMDKNVQDIISKARRMLDTKDYNDINKNKMEILFPLIEILGYDTTSPYEVVVSPVYNISGTQSFDYGLAEDVEEGKFKVVIKIVEYGTDFSKYSDLLKEAFAINDNIRYAIITDCFNYQVFENSGDEMQTLVDLIADFAIIALDDNDMNFLQIISKNGKLNVNSLYAVEKDMFDDFVQEEEQKPSEDLNESKPVDKKPVFSGILNFVKDPDKQKVVVRAGLMIIGGLLILMIAKFLMVGQSPATSGDPSQNDTNIVSNPNSSLGLNQLKIKDAGIQYINLNPVLKLHVYQPQDELEISLFSPNKEIPEGAVIKYEIYCGDFKKVIYSKIDKNGESKERFQIPDNWENPEVTVVAYLRFDEEDYPQPEVVKKAFGANGQYIIQKEGYPQYGLTYATTTHENQAVADYLRRIEEEKNQQLAITREKDFSKLETRIDPVGNIKHLPKGFEMDSANIKENRNIYPMIFYDANEKHAYFYIVAGFNSRQWIMFESIYFYGDGNKWSYSVGSNKKRQSLSDSYLSEWIYFNEIDTPTLLNDMNVLANSNNAKITFYGYQKKEHVLTQEEKDNINYMLYIYSTYYNNGKATPSVDWFNKTYQKVDLSYIVKPNDMRERDSANYKELKSLAETLAAKRTKGEDITKDEQELLDKMNSLYKPVSKELQEELYKVISSTTGLAIYDEDYENGPNSYFKIYFVYDKEINAENGYIPWINVYSNKKVHVPLRTDMASANKYDKTLVEFEISSELYNKLAEWFKSQTYKTY